MIHRDEILTRVSAGLDGRPARWTDRRTSSGDFDGYEWTVEVFDVAEDDQRPVHERLWPIREELRKKEGVRLTFVFHTSDATDKYYAWVRSERTGTPPAVIRLRPLFTPGLVRPKPITVDGSAHASA